MTPSGAVADTLKPGGDVLDRLMVPAVHLARVGVAQPLAHQRRQQRVLLDPDLVRAGRYDWCGGTARLCSSAPGTCDGMSCTSVPPHATFSTWMPRQIARIGSCARARRADQRDLELVAPGSASTTAGCAASPYRAGVDVVAAGQQQAVDAGQRLVDAASTARGSRTSPPTCRIACW